MRVYLIRHGVTKGNLEHRYVGSTEEVLLPEADEPLLSLKKRLEKDGCRKPGSAGQSHAPVPAECRDSVSRRKADCSRGFQRM